MEIRAKVLDMIAHKAQDMSELICPYTSMIKRSKLPLYVRLEREQEELIAWLKRLIEEES